MKPWILLFLLNGTAAITAANDSLSVGQVLQRIRYLQLHANKHFPAGMLPSYREYDRRRDVFKDDDNIFFTGLVVFTLKQLRPQLNAAERLLADSICTAAAPVYDLFKNKKGRDTYNFWRTKPPVVFPNGGWLNLMNRTHALPDDMDDTAITLMAQEAADSTVEKVHLLMQHHVNSGKKQKKKIRAGYRNIPAYSTWFGTRMPTDLDLCVLSNVLYLVKTRNIPFTTADSASLQLICTAIDNGDYKNDPSYISPHYGRTPIILYHFARLMQAGEFPALTQRKQVLITETRRQFELAKNPLDKILLSIALLKWGEAAPMVQMEATAPVFTEFEQTDFAFFVANMTSILPDPLRQGIGKSGIGRFYYYSPAYNDLLLLEYLVYFRQWKLLQN